MKKIFKYIISFIIGLTLFTSCDDLNEPIYLNSEDKFVAFLNTAFSVKENNGDKVGILVYISSPGGTGCTVNFDFDTTGIDLPAVEGVDFNLVNDSKTLTFNNYFGYDTIWIEPIDNDFYDKNKTVKVILSAPSNNFNLGRESSLSLTVVDNEHPLSLVIGDYTITYKSGFSSDFGTEYTVDIVTAPNPDDETQVFFYVKDMFPGWGFTEEVIYADVDLDEGTFKMAAGQSAPSYGYGPSKFTGFDADTDLQFEDGEFITGTIDVDGNITIPHYTGMQITEGGNAGLWFDLWASSIWNKSVKKGSVTKSATIVKEPRAFK